ncbi:unnamed protein product [Arctia plantaginis]|uniref:Uncharacterized protein n=1 Tax=Arctia plantaginis TaxID=874455 RepID=A0A8S1A1F3_ARCPL|nr:unnamed protein product [Arctia plantaginis]
MPMRGLIGDIQLEKEGNKIIFHDDQIDCSTDACTVKCSTNEPALDRLTPRSPYKIDRSLVKKMEIYGRYWLSYSYRAAGHATLAFGNVELKELIVEKPHCELKAVMSYACEACLEQPRVTIASYNVKTEGALEFESNCTWDRQYLSCNLEMYEIKQLSMNRFCNIYIPVINKTMMITFEYEYRGTLTDMKVISLFSIGIP